MYITIYTYAQAISVHKGGAVSAKTEKKTSFEHTSFLLPPFYLDFFLKENHTEERIRSLLALPLLVAF